MSYIKKINLKIFFCLGILIFSLLISPIVYAKSNSDNQALGWLKIEDSWFYFDEDGNRVDGWIKDDGKWYYGSFLGLEKGWVSIEHTWYYFDKDSGALLTDTITPDGFKVDKEGKYIK